MSQLRFKGAGASHVVAANLAVTFVGSTVLSRFTPPDTANVIFAVVVALCALAALATDVKRARES